MPGLKPGTTPNFEKPWSLRVGKELTELLRKLRFAVGSLEGTPETPSEIAAGATADAGVSQAPAPSDHIHSVNTAAPSVDVGGATPDEGTGAALMRADARLRLGIVTTKGDLLGHDGATPVRLPPPTIQRGGSFVSPSAASDVAIWRAPWPCTVTAVKGTMKAGTSATVNARRNGTAEHLAADLAVAPGAWSDGGAVQNTAYVAGDSLEVRLKGVVGAPDFVTVQVEFTRP